MICMHVVSGSKDPSKKYLVKFTQSNAISMEQQRLGLVMPVIWINIQGYACRGESVNLVTIQYRDPSMSRKTVQQMVLARTCFKKLESYRLTNVYRGNQVTGLWMSAASGDVLYFSKFDKNENSH